MKRCCAATRLAPSLLLAAFIAARPVSAQVVSQRVLLSLSGTSWQLFKFGGIFEFEPTSNDVIRAAPVRGTATYRERIALPANAVFEASLEDVSKAGAPAELIARVRNEQPGNPPIPFVIAYDPGRINQSHTYAVRARILVDDRLWFATDQHYPALTAGHGNDVQLLLRRSNGRTNDARRPISTAAPLENTHWQLTSLANTNVLGRPPQREPYFILNPANRSVTGSGGCNRLTGTYEVNGDRVSFNRIASTMMGCMSGMETEQAFLKALSAANRWRISGQRLDLFDGAGSPVARFEAVSTR